MKTTKLIFSILVLVFATSFTFAQDDVYSTPENKQSKEKKEKEDKEKLSKRKINTGYVFIDGKYVEPPYIVKRRGMVICINDIPITKSPELKKKRDYLIVKKDPGIPPDIQKMDSINAIYNAKIKPYDITYIEAKLAYIYRNFSEDEAVKLTKEYLESMPNIKSVIGTKICEVEAFNGEKRKMILTTNSFDSFNNSERNKLRLSKNDILNELIQRYEKRLGNGDVFFIFSDSTIYCDFIEVSYPEEYGIRFMHELSDIICNSNLSYPQKIELIKQKAKNNLINRYIPILINNFKLPEKIAETKDNNPNSGSNFNNFQKDMILEHYKDTEISFSPNSNKIHIASPDPWSNRFSDYLTFNQRINQIVDLVKDQGYENYPEFVSYIDYTNGDNLWEDLTFENFKDFANGGINYWNSHGSMDELDNEGIEMEGFIIICYYNTPELINVYFPDEIPIEFKEYTYTNPHENGWNGSNPPSIIAAYPEAATTFWKPSIDANNPILILETCYSYQNGFVEACGESGAVFGYQSESHYQPATNNYDNLFKRLNGKIGSFDICYRNTNLAFNNFIPADGFQMHPPNANITLCPATQSYFPTNNSTVPPAVNSGEFVIDTWCDASIPASDALSLVFTDGDLSYNPATDVYWDNPVDGKSNKIIYKWLGTHGTVRVNINTNNIIAYGGGGQELDFDRKTPNGESNAYYVFSVGYSNPNVVDFIASQYEILENISIQFTNQSTVYNPISYFWDFGDGATSTQENPSHTYTNQGIYDVTLRIITPENEFYETKNALITVLTECSGNLYASYDFITDKKVNFHASYTGAYEPLVNEYRFTIYFGDGTYQSEQGILNMENFEKTYSDFGDYYPVAVVETIDQFGETICLKEFEIGLLQISNPFPCSDFEVDFTISPPIAYNGIYGNSDVTVNFYNTTTGASNNCTWRWDFLSDIENGYEPVGGISTELLSSGNGNPQPKQYNQEGFYPVWLTATDWNTSCSESVSKLVTVANPIRCVNSLRIIGYDNLYTSNRLIVPWRNNNEECIITLRNSYSLANCIFCHCQDSCYKYNIAYNWNVNGERIPEDNQVLQGCSIELGAGAGENFYDTQITLPTGLFLPYRNTVGCFIKGDLSEINSSVSCYDTTNIEIIAINCDGFMDSNALNFAYAALISPFLPSFTLSGFALHNNNKLEFFSGSMHLDASANTIISNNDVVLYACNEIVLSDGFKTGNRSFETKTGDDYIEGCEPVPSYSNCFYDNIAENDVYIDNPFLNITPNPVHDYFQINLIHNINGFVLLEILDSQSRILKSIKSFDLDASEYSFEVKNFYVQPGIYFCRYTNSETAITTKFIKQ